MNLPIRPKRAQIDPDDSRPVTTHVKQEGSHFGDAHVRDGGIALLGNFAVGGGIIINSTARPDFAGQFSHSLLEPVKAYVPRPLLHDQIRTQLCKDADDSTNTLMVWGLGGAGKTQLVLDYVRQCRTKYKATFWIEAGQKASLERDFVNLYQTLSGVQMVAGQETISVERAIVGVKSWFFSQQGPWLMVFDGADAIENEKSQEYIDIRHFIPDVASLHVIITSRSSTAKDMSWLGGVQVGDMEEAQAIELFYSYSQLQRNNQDVEQEIKAIVKELGYLALAITLASTYVERTPRLQSDVKLYLPEYKRRRHELLKRKPESLIHQYSESVLTTWETSYQAIREQSPEASNLMTMLSFFSFDDIYLQLFSVYGQLETTASAGNAARVSSMLTTDTYKLEEWFEILQRYSFVQWKRDQKSYAMHKMVHAWGYDRLAEDEQFEFSRLTFQLLVEAIDGCKDTPEDKLRLVPHVMANFAALASLRSAVYRITDDTLDELLGIGNFMTKIGRLSEGCEIEKYVFNKLRRILGEEHPDTISAMSNLASTLGDLGQRDEAAKMKKEVLEKRRRILGEEHPDTISAMSNLANTLGDLGQRDEAAKMLQEVLEKRRRILGEEHPSTISAMNNLANILGELGQLDEAIALLEECVHKMKRIYIDGHPHLVIAIRNLNRFRASAVADKAIAAAENQGKGRGKSMYAQLKRILRRKGS